MSIFRLLKAEILHRKLNFMFSLVAVLTAATLFVAGPTMLRLYGSRRPEAAVEAAGSRPGTVLSIEQDGMRVATADGSLVFAKLRGEGRKGPAGEVATELGLEAGQVLGGGG